MADAVTPPGILAVSWCMPPAQFPRSIQVARLLKGLQLRGWNCRVVTPRVDQVAGAPIDEELARYYERHYELIPVDLAPGPQPRKGEDTEEGRWIGRAAAAVKRAVRERRPRALVTFAQPWRDHLVGLELAKWPGCPPWIAHFSDPWSDSPYYGDASVAELQAEREKEEQVVDAADMLVFTNEYAADLVMKKYRPGYRNKVRVLPHVTDLDLLPEIDRRSPPPAPSHHPLRLAHVGNLFAGRRRAHALFDALAAIDAKQSLKGRLSLAFIGEGSGLGEAREKVVSRGLEEIVSFRPRQSHFESLASSRDSDVLVLIDAPAETNVFFASKLADYLMAGKPLLMLTPAVGPSADIARDLGYPVLPPEDTKAIEFAIEDLLRRRSAGPLVASAQSEELSEVFGYEQVSAVFEAIVDDVERHAWSYPWKMARSAWRSLPMGLRGSVLFSYRAMRKVFGQSTLQGHRHNVHEYWPGIGPGETMVTAILFASLRFHSSMLRVLWSNAHRWRRVFKPAAVGKPARPKVLHVTSSFDLGGTQTQIKNLCTSGSERYQHEAIEIFPEMNFLYRRGETIDRSRYVTGGLIARSMGYFVSTLNTRSPQIFQTYKLVRDFQAARPDVVVGWGHEMCATTFVAAAITRVPHIVFCIRTFNPSYGWTSQEMGELIGIAHARMSRYVDAIVTNSTQLKADHANWLMVKEDTITACPNGITIETLPPAEAAERRHAVRAALRIPESARVIVNVGRFSAEKGQQSIVDANALLLERSPSSDAIFLLCGDGPTLAPVRDSAFSRGMTNIRFLGRTDRVQDYLCAADIFVMPSDFEGMPNAMMEAMAYGLPCVSTNRSGALDIARDGIEALYYEPRDAAQLARHLATLLDDPAKASAMGRRARERMQQFTVRRFADHFDRILDAVYSTEPTASPS